METTENTQNETTEARREAFRAWVQEQIARRDRFDAMIAEWSEREA